MRETTKSPIAAVVLDWAGTTIDHGSLAPVRTLQKVFAVRGIVLEDDVARRDMGLAKRDHIRNLLAEPEVRSAWEKAYPRASGEADIDELYREFLPLQIACLLDYAQVIDGVVPVMQSIRARGIRIGGTTGYTRVMLEALEAAARDQGYWTDRSLCPEDVGEGRPAPFMCWQLAVDLKVAPLSSCVKIGDTISDIEEGLNAGMWTVGLLRSGNMLGLSLQDWQALPEEHRRDRLAAANAAMEKHHAHITIESIAELLPALDAIEARIRKGERP